MNNNEIGSSPIVARNLRDDERFNEKISPKNEKFDPLNYGKMTDYPINSLNTMS